MIAHSGPHLVGMLGLSMLDPQVTQLLGELGVATPPLQPNREQDAAAPAHGLDFVFKPPHQIRNADSLDVTADDLVFSQLFFHGQGYSDYAAYAGELPYGLTFDTSVAAAKALLDPLATPDPKRRHSWDFKREYVMVRFTDDGTGITRVVVGLPWSGVVRREPRPDPRTVAAAALVDRLSARGHAGRRDDSIPPPGGYPAELVALRREQAVQENPFFAELNLLGAYAITLTVDPPDVHHYLSCPEGAGYERFFADILWLGQDNESGLVGYWKVEAETFVGAPVVRLDNEGSCQVVGPTLVDYYAGIIGDDDLPTLIDFCERAGLPLPGTEEQREEAVAGLPDPDFVMTEFVQREHKDARTNQPIRPLDRSPVLVTLADDTVVVVSHEDDLTSPARSASNAAFLFDPAAQRFRTLPSTAGRLTLHGRGVGLLPDGRAIFAENGSDTYCVVFDPASSDWQAGVGLGAVHNYAGATVLPDGRVLIAGGHEAWTDSIARCDLYDPRRDRWSATGPLTVARSSPALVPVAGGALAIGGRLPGRGFHGTDSCERYDVADGVWTPAAPLPFPMMAHTALVLRSGPVLVVSHEGWALYDPGADAWTRSQRLQPAQRAAVELADTRVAFFGGGQPDHAPETVFVLDVTTGDFTPAGNTLLPHGDSAAALLPAGTVLLVGGDLFDNLSKEPEIWDPATGRGQALPGLAEILDRQVRNLATHRSITGGARPAE